MIVSNAKQENIVQLLDCQNQLVIVKLPTIVLKVQHKLILFNALLVIIVQKDLPSQFHVQLVLTKTKLVRVLAKTVQQDLIVYKGLKIQ